EPKAVVMETTRSRIALQMHLNTIGNIAKAINADAFPRNPTGWWCSPKWCGYWGRCMGRGVTFVDKAGADLEEQLKASIDKVEGEYQPRDPTAEREPGEEG